MINIMFGYSINAKILNELEATGLNQKDINALERIINIKYEKSEELRNAIVNNLGVGIGEKKIKFIINKSKRLRLSRALTHLNNKVDELFPSSNINLSFKSFMMINPVVIYLRLRTRFLFFGILAKIRGQNLFDELINNNVLGYKHNYKQYLIFSSGHRNRTEKVMNVLRSIENYNFSTSKILVVGSRNEAELMLLDAYGFHHSEAIDLFSYSPRIKAMDMNEMSYPDDYFDIYYSSYVIKYSPDIKRTLQEAIRVTRNKGLMVFAFSFGLKSEVIPKGAELSRGVEDLKELLGNHIEHIYWNEEYLNVGTDMRAALILRLKK